MLQRLRKARSAATAWEDAIKQSFEEQLLIPDLGEVAAQDYLTKLRLYHKERTEASFRAAFGVDVSPMLSEFGMRPLMQEKLAENVALIKSIPEKLQEQVLDQFTKVFDKKGFDQEALLEMLDRRFSVAGSRAKLIARDQTSKTIGAMTKARQGQMGIDRYIWSTASDERVRPDHEILNNQVFLWSAPPEVGHPGEDIQCRCVAIAKVE